MSAQLLEARSVSKRFGHLHALVDVSAALGAGELLVLVGPDGAGKTTLLRALVGLVDVDGGEVRIEGVPWAEAPGGARERLGYMPQQYGLYADLSVDENLRFFADLFGIERSLYAARRAELLALTRLGDAHDRPAGALSGGMYKKLAVACALLHRPAALVLDEPTNGVDPVSRRELWALLHVLVSGGMGVVLSTPSMDEASRASRVVMLREGRVLEEGRPRELVARFEHVVLDVVAPDRGAVERRLAADASVLALSPAGPRLRAVVERDARRRIESALAAEGAEAREVPPDFEDLYLARARAS